MKGKLTEVQGMSSTYDVMCFTETHLDDSILNSTIFSGKNKMVYRKDRNIRGGGVMIAINSDIDHSRVELNTDEEVVGVFLPAVKGISLRSTVVLCIYNPPGKLIFSEETQWLTEVYEKYPASDFMVTGDFNMPDICWSDVPVVKPGSSHRLSHQQFLNTLAEYKLEQLVFEPTHVLGNTLDLICASNAQQIYDVMVVNPGLSDHYLISFSMTYKYVKSPSRVKTMKLYDKADLPEISARLREIENKIQTMVASNLDINEIWHCFTDGLKNSIERYVPIKVIQPKSAHEPVWFNRTARKMVNKQRRLYNRYRRTGEAHILGEYKALRRENKRKLRSIEQDYMERFLYEPLLNGNSKTFYSHIKKLRGNDCGISKILNSEGCMIHDATEIGGVLNRFFNSVFTTDKDMLKDTTEMVCGDIVHVEYEGVLKLLHGLKAHKAAGPDGFTKNDLILVPEVASLLTIVFEYSLQKRKLPDEWKMAHVVPIHKGGDKTVCSNYRPVSLTSIVCKTLEHIVLHNLNKYFDQILCENQHGFRKKLSCNSQLITTMHSILERVDGGECVQVATLDFAKAFDKVSHGLLIAKLKKYGIPDQLVEWIEDFLYGRYQQVILNGVASEYQAVTSGVPQGSVLGPSLFLFYINDIVLDVNSEIRLFADDVLMFSTVRDETSVRLFQRDLDTLQSWATSWKMCFNTSKCNVMYVGNTPKDFKEDLTYELCGDVLKRVESTKYLGVEICANLKWEHHINKLANKAYRVLGLLRTSLYKAPVKVKLLAYKTLCRPLLEYASDVWDPFLKKDIRTIEMVQHKAVRYILGLKGICSISDSMEKLELSTLEERRSINRKKTLVHLIEDSDRHKALMHFYDNLVFNEGSIQTRSCRMALPKAPRTNTGVFHNSFLPKTMRELRLSREPLF
jgi:hypothetical protein